MTRGFPSGLDYDLVCWNGAAIKDNEPAVRLARQSSAVSVSQIPRPLGRRGRANCPRARPLGALHILRPTPLSIRLMVGTEPFAGRVAIVRLWQILLQKSAYRRRGTAGAFFETIDCHPLFAGTAEAASRAATAAIRLAKLSRSLPAVLAADELPNLDDDLMHLIVTVEAEAVNRFRPTVIYRL